MSTPVILNIRRDDERRDNESPLSVESLIRQVHLIFRNAGIDASPSKVKKLVRAYKYRVEDNGFAFIDYLANRIVMSSFQRRVMADELTRVIAYSDPTGETAVHNVMRSPR